jgi:dTDP-4-amino-4,6-dideoxygalactose transaminase
MGNKIPLYGEEDWFSLKHLSALEMYIAGKHTCATNTVQTAVQACLELLGTRTDVVPVIMPVTAPPDTLAAVLRSGAHPLLLDIEEETLQVDPEQLRDAISMLAEEERVPIVLLNRPFGQPVLPELLEAIADLPSVCDSRLIPHSELEEDDLPCSFSIFDLTPICGSGAIIVHPFVTQVKQLKEVRNGPMGLSGALSEQQAKHAVAVLKSFPLQVKLYEESLNQLMSYGLDVMGPSKWPAPLWLKVPNARLIVAHLASYGIASAVGLYPLYGLEEVRRRYTEEPEYPVAEKLENSFVCIPTHQKVQGREEEIVNRIKEVL